MPRIPEDLIERVKDAADIVEIITEHVQLRKAGRNFVGLCPFHNEKTPSFSVNPDLQIYKCFGCGAGGNVFRFLQEVDRISFIEAVSFLAERHGIQLETQQNRSDTADTSDALYQANDLARKYFQYLLHQEEGVKALEYFKQRGLEDETLERFGLGYAPPGWDGLLKVAGQRHFKANDLKMAGLLSHNEQRNSYYDRFRDRVTFPIANVSGRTIGFGARTLDPEGQPKYLNSPETPIYRKSQVLYGLDHSREAIRKADTALVVEGYMDQISLFQAGIHNAVASAGTALTPEHCRLLGRYAKRIVLLFDGDAAGSAAAVRGLEALITNGLEALVVSLPDNHDPDSFIRKNGIDGLNTAIEQAQSGLDFLLRQFGRQWDLQTMSGKAQAIESVKPLLAQTRDPVRRDLLLREFSQRLGVGENALRQEVGQQMRRHAPRAAREAAPKPIRRELPRHEREFMGFLLKHPTYIGPTAERLESKHFSDERAQGLAAILFGQYATASQLDLAMLLNRIEDSDLAELVSDCAMLGFDEEKLSAYWEEAVLHFEIGGLTQQIDSLQQQLSRASQQGDEETLVGIIRTQKELIGRREAMRPVLDS
jgi:DNA primase